MKRFFVILGLVLGFAGNVYAEENFESMSSQEQAEMAGSYFEEIIKYIKSNYVGEDVNIKNLMQTAIRAMVDELDEYSDYLTKEEYEALKNAERTVWYAPDFECDFSGGGYPIISKLPKTSSLYKDGVRVGDEIRAIKGVSSYDIGEEEYNESVTSNIAEVISMKIARGDSIKEYSVSLSRVEYHSVNFINDMSSFNSNSQKYNDESVGYIKISSFNKNTSNEFSKELREFKNQGKTKLILDLRGNTGGYVDEAIGVARQIVPSGVIITARDKGGKITTYTSDLKVKPYEKCVVLVDGLTASASEIVASAMQDSGAAKIVGEQTFGKGVMQSVMEFDDIGYVKMTTMEYSSRYGKKIDGIGITPNVTVDKILFVNEGESLDNENVIAAIKFLGYKVDKNNTVARNIGRYQAEMGLKLTYELDGPTVAAMNYEIYTELMQNDRVLSVGYINLLG